MRCLPLLCAVVGAAVCGCGNGKSGTGPVGPGDTTGVPTDTLTLRQLTGRHELSTQAQVDSLAARGGAVYRLDGSLVVRGRVDSLTVLRGLRRVSGDLEVAWNTSLAALTGLAGVDSIEGSLRITKTELSSLRGLEALASVGGHLRIDDNADLVDLSGLSGLVRVTGAVSIDANTCLGSLAGLEALSMVGGGVAVTDNRSLPDSAVQAFGASLRERGFAGAFTAVDNGLYLTEAVAFVDESFEYAARSALGRSDRLPILRRELASVTHLNVGSAPSMRDLVVFPSLGTRAGRSAWRCTGRPTRTATRAPGGYSPGSTKGGWTPCSA